jgi:hypothetical protein
MSWNSVLGSYGRISALLENHDCTLLQLIREDNIKVALRRQAPRLVDFMVAHVDELIDIALGVITTDVPSAQSTCFQLIITPVHPLTAALIVNTALLTHLSDYISSDQELAVSSIAVFSRVVAHLVQASNGSVLDRFPEKESLFRRILKHLSFSAIFHLLHTLVENDRKSVRTFLEDNRATEVLLDALCDDDATNSKILRLMAEIIGSVDLDSILLVPFETRDSTERIVSFAFTSPSSRVSAKAFAVLCDLSYQFADGDGGAVDSTDPLFDTVFGLLLSKIDEICEFILRADRFLDDRVRALDLVCSLLSHPGPVPEPAIALAVALVDKLFRQPSNSSFHIRFTNLVGRVARDPEQFSFFCHESGIQAKIIGTFAKRGQLQASFWGTLYNLATTIDSTIEDESPEWTTFVETAIEPIQATLGQSYGGPRPAQDDIPPEEDVIFPLGRSEQPARDQVRLPPTVTVLPKAMAEDEEDDVDLEEDDE